MLYNRLTQKDLLARCSCMKTQNASNYFNTLVQKRCPKTEFASRRDSDSPSSPGVQHGTMRI